MKKRMVKLLSLALSGMLTLSSLGSMTVFAAPEEDFGDRLEEQFEAENEVIEDDAEVEETSLDVEEENIDNVEITTEELVPPVDVKWEAPGILVLKLRQTNQCFMGMKSGETIIIPLQVLCVIYQIDMEKPSQNIAKVVSNLQVHIL